MLVIQILAFTFCFGGIGAVIAATVSNEWKVTSRATSVITATWVFQGLWMNCAGNALGAYHCRPHFTIFRTEGASYAPRKPCHRKQCKVVQPKDCKSKRKTYLVCRHDDPNLFILAKEQIMLSSAI